ncbi:MAG: ATP-grasp domain-containing protein [Thermodesulfobacteriota bacterium]
MEKRLRIAIFTTRTRAYHPNGRLLESASRMGHLAFLLHPRSVLGATFTALPDGDLPQVVVPRIGSTMEDHELAALFHLERCGVPCLNGYRALVVARDKFLSLRELEAAGIPVPRTVMVQQEAQVRGAIKALGGFPVVAKGLRGRQGSTVTLVQDMGFARYLVSHPPFPIHGVLFQEFLPTAAQGDVRIVVVRQKVVASMRRLPRPGEFRANVHLRARGIPCQPPSSWVQMALKAASALGLDVAGVDMMEGPRGPVVLEVNTTPGFKELERVTGVDVAGEIVRGAVELAQGGWACASLS